MKRQTFVKQLMALGFSRNEANKDCREALAKRDYVNTHGGKAFVAWENALVRVCFVYSVINVHPTGRWLTQKEQRKFWAWIGKRTKAHPLISWKKNHPDRIKELVKWMRLTM